MWGGIPPPLGLILLAPFDHPFVSTTLYGVLFYLMTYMKRSDALSLLALLSPLVLYHFGVVLSTQPSSISRICLE